MLNKLFKGLAVATLMLIGNPTLPQAATINLENLGLVAGTSFPNTFEGTLEENPLGGLTFDNGVLFGATAVSITELGADFNLLLSEPAPSMSFLTGSSTAIGSDDNLIEILFSATAIGTVDGFTGSSVLASLVGSNGIDFGAEPFSFLSTSGPVSATLTLTNVAPIPLPAGIVLILSALGSFMLFRRRC